MGILSLLIRMSLSSVVVILNKQSRICDDSEKREAVSLCFETASQLSYSFEFLIKSGYLVNVGVGVHYFQRAGAAKSLLHIGDHSHFGFTVNL